MASNDTIMTRVKFLIGMSVVITSVSVVLLISALLVAGWIIIDSRVKVQHIDSTRFTADDGKELRELILRNREETITNRKLIEQLEAKIK